MFDNIIKFFKKTNKKETLNPSSKDTAKERLHLVLMQDRANVSADFLDLMREEIIEVIKKYIDIDESAMDVRLTNQANEDGTQGAPALYANIPILNIKDNNKAVKKESEEKRKTAQEEDPSNNRKCTEEEEKKNEDTTKQEEKKKIEEAKKIVEEKAETENEKIESDKKTENKK